VDWGAVAVVVAVSAASVVYLLRRDLARMTKREKRRDDGG
jgi:hypothetical protein